MRARAGRGITIAYATLGTVALAAGVATGAVPQVEVRTTDVDLFYRIYDAAGGHPDAPTLQRDYLDAGSEGVRQFIPQRIRSADALAKAVATQRDVYEKARACAAALPAARARLAGVFRRLAAIDPDATFPPVIVLVGRNTSGGTTGRSGVLIGLEVVCRSNWLQPDLTDRLVHLIAHEYGHVQQFPAGGEDLHPDTVLKQSLIEGGAELVAELTSGEASEAYLQGWTRGHERDIGRAFMADLDSTDLKPWLYNGAGTPDQPGDLGYWVGYCIAKSYYGHARDKRAAMRALLELQDPRRILLASRWQPGDVPAAPASGSGTRH